MRPFVLDTNTLVYCLRQNPLFDRIEEEQGLANDDAILMVSVATVAELRALVFKFGWGQKKLDALDKLLGELLVVDITHGNNELIDAYARIDAFSQGKLPNMQLGLTARNMAKNDLWIAATAHVANATLITSDGDFTHLDGHFLKLASYKLQ